MRRVVFKLLTANNFLCFEKVTIVLNGLGLTIIEGINLDDEGSNGSGKTSVIKLFFYLLTGHTPEGLETEDILPDFTTEGSKASLIFSIDSIEYGIERYRNHNKHKNNLYFYKTENNQMTSLTCHKVVDTQAKIFDVLGMDEQQLLLMTIFSTDTIHFARCKPADRRQLFIDLFKAIQEFPQVYAPEFKNKRTMVSNEIATVYKQILTAEATIASEKGQLKLLLEEIQRQKEQKAPSNEVEINRLQELIKTKIEAYNQIKNKLGNLNTSEGYKQTTTKLEETKTRVNELNIEHESLTFDKTTSQNRLTRISDAFQREKQVLTELKGIFDSGECSTCGTHLDIKNPAPKLKAKIQEAQKKYKELQEEGTKLKRTIEDLSNKLYLIQQKLDTEYLKFNNLAGLNNLFKDRDEIKTEIENLEPQLTYLKANIDIEENQIVNLCKKKDDLEVKITSGEIAIKNLKENMSKLETEEKTLEYLIKISLNDIPTYLLNSYLQELEIEASLILAKLFPGMRVILSDTFVSKKGNEKPELSLKIQNNLGYDKKYTALSAAERQMVDISLLIGLQRVVEQRTSCSTNLLFLDEILDLSSDELRSTNVLNFIYDEVKDYDNQSSMFLISHKQINKQWADNRFTVTKKNGISTLA